MPDKRKMAFFEINNGKLAIEMQEAFERASKIAQEENLSAEVTLKIKIFPSADGKFGKVTYQVQKKDPVRSSIELTTQITPDGIITADGSSKIDVLQEDLEFPEEPVLHKLTNRSV
jgi:hypothetical protein